MEEEYGNCQGVSECKSGRRPHESGLPHRACLQLYFHDHVHTQNGLSSLMLCCEEGNSEMANLLLEAQADTDLQQSVEFWCVSGGSAY